MAGRRRAKTSGFDQRSRIPLTITSTCLVGEHAAGALRKSRHRRPGNSTRCCATQDRVVCNRQVHGIRERDRSSTLSL